MKYRNERDLTTRELDYLMETETPENVFHILKKVFKETILSVEEKEEDGWKRIEITEFPEVGVKFRITATVTGINVEYVI